MSVQAPVEAPTGQARPGIGLRERVIANFGLLLNTTVWGTFFPLVEVLLRHWDLFSATAGRQVIGTIVLFATLWLVERKSPFRRGLPWGRMMWLGFIGITLGSLVTTLAVFFSSGLSAAIISATNPISSAITAWVLHRVPLTRRIVIGAVLAVAGGLLAAMATNGGRMSFGLGEIAIVVSNVMWAWFSLGIQHHLRGMSQLERNAYTLAPAALTLVLLVLVLHVTGLYDIHIPLEPEPVLCLLYIGVVPIALGNYLWHWGISRIGVNIAAMYQNMIPVAAVLVTLWMGQYPTWGQLAGGAIIVAGVLYAQLGAFRRRTG
jgi:drug/metabolite transporter (DMT)-like permease